MVLKPKPKRAGKKNGHANGALPGKKGHSQHPDAALMLNRIFEEDCMAFLARAPAESLDVIVTSPPYNIGKDYSKYDDSQKDEDYVAWMGRVAEASKRVLKDEGSFFLNIVGSPSNPWLAFEVAQAFGKHFVLQNTIHWVKSLALPKDEVATKNNGLNGDISIGHFKPINTPRYLNQCHEYIFQFSKEGTVPLDKLAIGVPYQHESNITRWKTKGNKRDRGNAWFMRYENKQGAHKPVLHPAMFPEKLPYLCIKLHGVKPGLVVYDPFMGIGTTALACIRLGVAFVGTEIDPRYVQEADRLIKERLKDMPKGEVHAATS